MTITSILKQGVLLCVQVCTLAVVQVFGFVVGAQLAGVLPSPSLATSSPVEVRTSLTDSTGQASEQASKRGASARSTAEKQARQARMFGILVLVCLLNSAVMTFWIRQTSLVGIRLVGVTFFIFFFCMTIMPQIETLVFLRKSTKIIQMAAAMGLCVAVLFAISTVPVMWRWKKTHAERWAGTIRQRRFRQFSRWNVARQLVICVAVYVMIYLTFGYFVAWQNPELRILYGGNSEHLLGFWQRIFTSPVCDRVIPLQVLRGIAWTLVCVAMISVSTSSRWVLAILIGLVLAIVMNSQLLLPNPIMSASIRFTHMLETAASNFLFGAFCVLIWTPSRRGPFVLDHDDESSIRE